MADLYEYTIRWSNLDISYPVTIDGSNEFYNVCKTDYQKARNETTYDSIIVNILPFMVLAWMTRPDEHTIDIHRLISNKTKGDEFYTELNSTVYNNLRQMGWNIDWSCKEYSPDSSMEMFPIIS